MNRKKNKNAPLPKVEKFEEELKRLKYKALFIKLIKSTFYTLIVVAAAALLVAVLFMPVLRVYGGSMAPTLNEGDILVSVKGANIDRGDLVSFYSGSKLMIRRCIATEGETVDIDTNGNIYVDGKLLKEEYIKEKAFGKCSAEMPCKVPKNSIFVVGDDRLTSVDSRSQSMGCINLEDTVGEVFFRVWPIGEFGFVS